MKQKLYILGVVTVLIIFIGIIFKVNHWPGAGYLLIIGIAALVLAFIPFALINHYKAEGNRQNLLLHIVTWLTCFVVFGGMLYKIMHWPGAGIVISIAIPFPYIVFLPVFLVTTGKNKNFNIYNTVFVFILLAVVSVFSALLALNVSASRIRDSYNISRDYNNIEKVLNKIPSGDSKSQVSLQIDKVLKIVDEYQYLILKKEGISEQQWEADADNLIHPDSPNIPMAALAESGESEPGDRLQNAFKELFAFMEQNKSYESICRALPVILGQAQEIGTEPDWTIRRVSGTNLSWVLIYLDGVETNLKLIKATL
jgi:hypothetical protein